VILVKFHCPEEEANPPKNMCPLNKFILLLALLTSGGRKIKSSESPQDATTVDCDVDVKRNLKDLIESSAVIMKAFVGNKLVNVTGDRLQTASPASTRGHVPHQQIRRQNADTANDGMINHEANINYVPNDDDKNVGYFIITLAPIVVYKGTFLLRHLEMFNNQQYFVVNG
jgi:hypothetical protein